MSVALFLPCHGLCAPSWGVSGRGQGRTGCLFPSALTENLCSRMEALFSAAAAESKVAQSKHIGDPVVSHVFVHVSSSGAAPLLGYQRHCSQPCQKDECFIYIFRNIFISNNFGCSKCYYFHLKTYLYIIAAPYCTLRGGYIVFIVFGKILWKNTESRIVFRYRRIKHNS